MWVLVIIVLAFGVSFGGLMILDRSDDMNSVIGRFFARMENNSSPRGYLGIIGAILFFLGELFPFEKIWFVSVSIFKDMRDENLLLWVILVVLPIVTALLYCFSFNKAACLFGVISLVLLVGIVISEDDIPLVEVTEYLASGFWIMLAESILMILSKFMTGANRAIAKLFGQ